MKWTPDLSSPDENRVKINFEIGRHKLIREFQVDVLRPKLAISATITTSGGGILKIDKSGTILDGLKIVFPSNSLNNNKRVSLYYFENAKDQIPFFMIRPKVRNSSQTKIQIVLPSSFKITSSSNKKICIWIGRNSGFVNTFDSPNEKISYIERHLCTDGLRLNIDYLADFEFIKVE